MVIVEERSYVLEPGKVPEFLRLVETLALPVSRPTLGGLIGYFTTEIGALNQVVHLWAYESLDERARRRARLAQEPRWQLFLRRALPLIRTMENRILLPAPFTPLTMQAVAALQRSAPPEGGGA